MLTLTIDVIGQITLRGREVVTDKVLLLLFETLLIRHKEPSFH